MYDGQWRNGKQEGVGKYTTAKGETKYGKWADGNRLEWVTEDTYRQYIDEV